MPLTPAERMSAAGAPLHGKSFAGSGHRCRRKLEGPEDRPRMVGYGGKVFEGEGFMAPEPIEAFWRFPEAPGMHGRADAASYIA